MALQLYDTMTRKKRAFVPINPERVTMYVCGPTVYNYAHIGNARPVVVFDVLFRLLRSIFGERHVLYAANVTDVDDKINQKAIAEGVPIETITQRYLDAYHADMSALGALKPTFEPRATGTMDAIIAMIERLVRNNAAYENQGHVLFNTAAYSDYGKLSGRSLDDMIAGARVDVAPYKQNPADFVLWKPSKEGEPVWESPFGPGRPGWHIECSAMIHEAARLPIDIHGGGNDLIFPHHENEMAQGLCANDARYANYWLHNGFVRATDPRAAQIIDHCDAMSPDAMARLHGVLRDPHAPEIPTGLVPEIPEGIDWWDPLADNAVRPEIDAVLVNGIRIARGSRVRLRPRRNADAQDIFVAGKTARVTSVHEDVEGNKHVGVVVDDDPAADLHDWYGRYLYFSPDEVEPLEAEQSAQA